MTGRLRDSAISRLPHSVTLPAVAVGSYDGPTSCQVALTSPEAGHLLHEQAVLSPPKFGIFVEKPFGFRSRQLQRAQVAELSHS